MEIDRINLNNLRVFECVYRTQCMTSAAKELHLTQSGVSQHIKALEQTLGVNLFDRIKKKIIPTFEGDGLFQAAEPALIQLENALVNCKEQPKYPSEMVKIGMPIEYGTNMVIPLLADIAKNMPSLKFQLTLDYAKQMNDLLLSRELDFAFVDAYNFDSTIALETVGEEQVDLCASEAYFRQVGPEKTTKVFFESLNYVAYQKGEPVLRSWFSHHIRRKNIELNVRAQVMDVRGTARFIVNELGAGILPDHLVGVLRREGFKVHVFEGSGRPMTNKISLAYLKKRSQRPGAQHLIGELKKKLSQIDKDCFQA